MLSEVLVSVVIPTIRLDNYLRAAVESVLAQDHRHIEVVIVVDGPEIQMPIAWDSDARIRIVQHGVRRGTPNALNTGIAEAHGKYIARLDADDVAHPRRLAVQVSRLEHEIDVVCVASNVELIDADGTLIRTTTSPSDNRMINRELLSSNPLVHSSVMYRTEAVRAIGGYNPQCARMQDYELYLRLARTGSILLLSEKLVQYRIHPGQHSRLTSPWSISMREVIRARRTYAQYLRVPGLEQTLRDTFWFMWQVLRHNGVVRPRYM